MKPEKDDRIVTLRIAPGPFNAVCAGIKTAEFRKTDDRDFRVRDVLRLREYADGFYTGYDCHVRVTHCQYGHGIPEGFVMMSIKL